MISQLCILSDKTELNDIEFSHSYYFSTQLGKAHSCHQKTKQLSLFCSLNCVVSIIILHISSENKLGEIWQVWRREAGFHWKCCCRVKQRKSSFDLKSSDVQVYVFTWHFSWCITLKYLAVFRKCNCDFLYYISHILDLHVCQEDLAPETWMIKVKKKKKHA